MLGAGEGIHLLADELQRGGIGIPGPVRVGVVLSQRVETQNEVGLTPFSTVVAEDVKIGDVRCFGRSRFELNETASEQFAAS